MGKHDSYYFMPRPVQARTSYFNPLNIIFNYESCYQDYQLNLRQQILVHRNAAYFDKDLLILGSSWFSNDIDVAFEDVNKKSYFLASKLKPRQRLVVNDFRVLESTYSSAKWDSLKLLEVEIADFLLMRNHLIASSRAEHLNAPMNFFFVDVKRIIRSLAKEKNTKQLLKSINAVESYITNVETELAFDDRDRLFINQLKRSLNKQVKVQVQNHINKANLRADFESLMLELKGVIESSNTVTHFSYQDGTVNEHPSLLTNSYHADELSRYPTRALIDCAKKIIGKSSLKTIEKDNVVMTEVGQNIFYRIDENKYVPNTQLLKHCENVRLISGLSNAEKENYILAVSKINNLLEFDEIFKMILNLFDEAGQYKVILDFKEELSSFLGSLKLEISSAKKYIADTVLGNQQLKDELLKKQLTKSYFKTFMDVVSDKTGLFNYQGVNVKRFILNQDVKQIITAPGSEQVFDSALNSASNLLNKIESWHDNYQKDSTKLKLSQLAQDLSTNIAALEENSIQLYGKPVTQTVPAISSANEVKPPPNPSSSTYISNCQLAYDPGSDSQALVCISASAKILVYPKEVMPSFQLETLSSSKTSFKAPLTGDYYDVTTCKPINLNGVESVGCNGEETTMIYQPEQETTPADFINQIGGQLALGFVLCQMGKNTYRWLFTEKDSAQVSETKYLNQSDGRKLLDKAYKSIAKIKRKTTDVKDQKWLNFSLDELIYDLKDLTNLNGKQHLTLDMIESKQNEIDYFIDSITKVNQVDVVKHKKLAYEKLSQKSGLAHDSIHSLVTYFSNLSNQLLLNEFVIDKKLELKIRSIQNVNKYSSNELYNIAEQAFFIEQLTNDLESVMKTDLQNIEREIKALSFQNEVLEVDSQKGTLLLDIEYLKSKSGIVFIKPKLPKTLFHQQTNFFQTPKERGNHQQQLDVSNHKYLQN